MKRLLLGALVLFSLAFAACDEAGNIDGTAAVATAQVLLQTDKLIKASGGNFEIQPGATCKMGEGFAGTITFTNSLERGMLALNYLGSDGGVVRRAYTVIDGQPDFSTYRSTSKLGLRQISRIAADRELPISLPYTGRQQGITHCQIELWTIEIDRANSVKVATALVPLTANVQPSPTTEPTPEATPAI